MNGGATDGTSSAGGSTNSADGAGMAGGGMGGGAPDGGFGGAGTTSTAVITLTFPYIAIITACSLVFMGSLIYLVMSKASKEKALKDGLVPDYFSRLCR